MSSRRSPPKQSSSSSNGSTATKRLLQELSKLRSEGKAKQTEPITSSGEELIERLGPVDGDDLFHWEAVISGRGMGGGYDGGRWLLDITIPTTYPLNPPVCRFITRIVAANVKLDTGEICLDLLKDKWSPAYTIKATVEAIWQMLANPGVDSPLNIDVAALLRDGDAVGAEGLVRYYVGEREGVYTGR